MSTRFHGPKVSRTESEKHLNWMGGASYDVSNPIHRLRIAASTCFFGEPKYYEQDKDDTRPTRIVAQPYVAPLTTADVKRLRETLNAIDPVEWRGKPPAEMMEMAIDAALAFDPRQTLEEAVRLRQIDHIRTTPQVILVRAAHHPKVRGTGLVRKYAPGILERADEPSVGLAYQLWRYKDKPIPNALKKAWATRLAAANEYELAKYRMGERAVKTVDVVNLVHAKSPAIGKLMKGELTNENATWEAIISKDGASKASWTKAISVMGHMALLRNLRNFLEHKVDPTDFIPKLVAGVEGGKQLPFRYYSAYKAVEDKAPGPVLDAIEACLMASLGNLPTFTGRTMSLCDNSGSARGATTSSMGTMKISEIANLTAILTGMASEDGYIGVFGNQLEVSAVRKRSSVFDQLKLANDTGAKVGADTENGIWLFWDRAIKNREHWDNVFVYSDMQAGHGGLYGMDPRSYANYIWGGYGARHIDVGALVNAYRAKVNPNVNVFLVQVAGYQDTILPEFYRRTYILGGWGEGLLKFAHAMANLPSQ